MLILRCTQKLLQGIDITEDQLVANDLISESKLGNWHANVIRVLRQKGILFVNDATLFSFVIFDVPKAVLKKKLPLIFNATLCKVLRQEGFSADWIEQIKLNNSPLKFGRSNNKKVLGTINDLTRHYEFAITDYGGIMQCNFDRVIYQMNRIPQKNLGWSYAIEIMQKVASTLH